MTDKRHQRVIDYLNSRGKSPAREWIGWVIFIFTIITLAIVYGDQFDRLSPITQAVSVIIICGFFGILFIIKFVKR